MGSGSGIRKKPVSDPGSGSPTLIFSKEDQIRRGLIISVGDPYRCLYRGGHHVSGRFVSRVANFRLFA